MVSPKLNPRAAVAASTAALFAHADYPLARSLDYRGDPGLFGPGSASWEVLGDVATFIGGIRALLIQAAHPEVVAGVADHSSYEDDPLGRLSRTSAYVTATGYGAMPEVEAALAAVRKAHRPVHGVSHRSRRYSASGGEFASWVHNALIDSFVTAHAVFGPGDLSQARADQFVREQTGLGAMLGADVLPDSRDGLADWIASHPELDASPAVEEVVSFLQNPPLPGAMGVGYRVLFRAASATLPPRIAAILGVRDRVGAIVSGRALIDALRWVMGASPSWWLALERVGEPPPDGVRFKRRPPIDATSSRSVAA